MENNSSVAIFRQVFAVLQEGWIAETGLSGREHVACCRRLLETDDPTPGDWIRAATRVLAGEYPRGEEVEARPSWRPGRARAIHASLAEAVRLYGLGVGKKHLHGSFWKFCFQNAARVPQELEHEETQQLISMWVDANRPVLAKVYQFPSRAR